jgi:ketosteroid isomerase-like protein
MRGADSILDRENLEGRGFTAELRRMDKVGAVRSSTFRIPHLPILATSFAATVLAASAPASDSADPSAASEIRAVLDAQVSAWNRGDLDAFMNGYARSNDTAFVGGDGVTRGWQTVLDRYRKKYSGRGQMGTLTFSELQITLISSDAALVLGRWELKREKDAPHGYFTLLFRRTRDGWRIVHDHTSAAAPSS